jgi:hypothetical protein
MNFSKGFRATKYRCSRDMLVAIRLLQDLDIVNLGDAPVAVEDQAHQTRETPEQRQSAVALAIKGPCYCVVSWAMNMAK